MIVFRRKNFGILSGTAGWIGKSFNNAGKFYNSGQYSKAIGSALGGVGKSALVAAPLVGGYKAISTTKDALTGELGNSN